MIKLTILVNHNQWRVYGGTFEKPITGWNKKARLLENWLRNHNIRSSPDLERRWYILNRMEDILLFKLVWL